MIAYSSELYKLDTKDVAALPNGDRKLAAGCKDSIVILIGNNTDYKNRGESKDVLLKGRKKLNWALKNKYKYVKVRIAFEPKNNRFDLISPIIRVLRYRLRTYSSNIYHMSPQDIRNMKIERNIRTKENAYVFSNPKYQMNTDERKKSFMRLLNSIKRRGFDDNHPLDIMLCRNMGVKDTLNQGHHRMAAAMEANVKRVSVMFSSAGAMPEFLRPLFLKIAKINMFFKHEE